MLQNNYRQGGETIYNKIFRDDAYRNELKQFIEEKYNLCIHSIHEAKRGFFGETWKIITASVDYFVKIDYCDAHKQIYMNSLEIVEHLTSHNITHISKILKTNSNQLFTIFNSGVLGVFDFVIGENTEDYPVSRLFEKLAPIYKVQVSTTNVYIRKEDYDIGYIDDYYNNFIVIKSMNTNPSANGLTNFLEEKSQLIKYRAERLEIFAKRCKDDYTNFYITHGDAGGNSIIDGDNFSIIDWDYPMLSPIERDAWFFMSHEKDIMTINQILNSQDIDYKLQKNRLAFYCYYSFFYYLHEHLTCFFDFHDQATRESIVEDIKGFFSCWINNQMNIADKFE